MKNSYRGHQGGSYGERKSGVKGAFGHRRSNNSSDLHDAVCSGCGDNCQVPFKPNGKKPVFCTNCFKRDDAGSAKHFDRPVVGAQRSAGQSNMNLGQIEARLSAIEEKIDALIDALTADLDDEDEDDDESDEVFDGEQTKS